MRDWDELPAGCKAYVEKIEELTGVECRYLGVGPGATRSSSSLDRERGRAGRGEYLCVLYTRRSGGRVSRPSASATGRGGWGDPARVLDSSFMFQ